MEERPRGKDYFRKRKGPTPRAILLLVIFIILLLYLIFGSLGGGRARALKNYLTAVNKVAEDSNKIAKGFHNLKKNAKTLSRGELKERLELFAKENKKLLEAGEKIKPPEPLKKAHLYFLLSLDLRERGLENYRPALFNALKDIDLEVASHQVASALKDLSLSDRAYSLFTLEINRVLKKEGIKATVSPSKFLKEDTAYEKLSLIPYLQRLKGVKSLEETHGLTITSLTTQPKQVSYISGRKLAILPKTKKLSVRVVVENQGNQIEFNLPVVATLKSTEKVKEQKQEMRIVSIDPGEKKTVTITDLKPRADEGVVNLLTVTVGPVPKEKNTKNNTQEFKFMLRASSGD